MTLYTIGTQAQALYPFQEAQKFAITNEGPWTVLIDQVSSINNGSYELPPLSSIAWDARRPLWIAAKPPPDDVRTDGVLGGYVNSQVRITPNSDVLDAPRGQASILLATIEDQDVSVSAGTYPIETQAFSTLTIAFEKLFKSNYADTDFNPPQDKFNVTIVSWFSEDGFNTLSERFVHPYQDDIDLSFMANFTGQRLTIPVKDAYCIISSSWEGVGATPESVHLKYNVYGQLRELPDFFQYWISPTTGNARPMWPEPVAVAIDSPNMASDFAGFLEWSNAGSPNPPDLWIAPVKKRCKICVRFVGLAGTGTLSVQDAKEESTVYTADIAAGSSTVLIDLDLPTSYPLLLRSNIVGTSRVSFVWSY